MAGDGRPATESSRPSPASFSISNRDWSLHRQGPKDEARHNEKLKEAVKEHLPVIISDGSVITADPRSKRKVRVKLKSLELPHIRYKQGDSSGGFGAGPSGTKPGDVIGRRKKPGKGDEPGPAGDEEGEEFYEAEFSLEEIQEMVFQDLGLPNLKPRQRDSEMEEVVFDTVRHRRSTQNLDIVRTAMRNMERNAVERGSAELHEISPDDYMNRSHRIRTRDQQSAVAILMADASGSMGELERYLTRAFCWWTVAFLRSRYPRVEVAFILHHTKAWETDEDHFFRRGESGGTMCSSANQLCWEMLQTRYQPSAFNVYPVHFSDGENLSDDDSRICARLIEEMLLQGISQYAYVEVGELPGYQSYAKNLGDMYRETVKHENFRQVEIRDRDEVIDALKEVFRNEVVE